MTRSTEVPILTRAHIGTIFHDELATIHEEDFMNQMESSIVEHSTFIPSAGELASTVIIPIQVHGYWVLGIGYWVLGIGYWVTCAVHRTHRTHTEHIFHLQVISSLGGVSTNYEFLSSVLCGCAVPREFALKVAT